MATCYFLASQTNLNQSTLTIVTASKLLDPIDAHQRIWVRNWYFFKSRYQFDTL